MIGFDAWGEGEPPLVLVHGVGTTRGVWYRAGPLLAARRRVLAFDVPGFGGAPVAGPGFALDAVADALAEAIAAEAPAFDLLGHSLGGAVATVLAARHPRLVRRLVLSAPAGFSPRPGALAGVIGVLAEGWLPLRRVVGGRLHARAAARRALLFGTVADGARLDPEDARMLLRASQGAQHLGAAVAAAVRADLADVLAGVDVPVGVLWGDRDRVIPFGVSERVRAARPGAPLEVVRGAGHIPQIERPEEMAAAVERLLERLPAPG